MSPHRFTRQVSTLAAPPSVWGSDGVTIPAIVWVGFSRSDFLRVLFTVPPLTPTLHAHGFVLALWLALFIVQATLIAGGRRHAHRTPGVAGVLGAIAVLTSYAAAFETAARAQARRGRLSKSVQRISARHDVRAFVVAGALFAAGQRPTRGSCCSR